ncbi:hypothetical protein EH31_04390 [Erythrobacter longus]|uniref:Uncharacterized protein n=1 Tax=Erythrobacter longus TaxID=1044 RepID=A0A074MAR9_ERYLO|nr:hypothetical protein [Erythrobacter longus]KEO91916.1 hypothetical protein EH31_04390 [Erythrobacter longus]
MISQKRLLAAILLASIVNAILMVTVFRDGNAILDGRVFEAAYWSTTRPHLGSILVVALFASGLTGIGLFLLLIIARPFIPHVLAGWLAKVLFVLTGSGLGFLMTLVLFGEELGAFYGFVTAVCFAVMCSDWFKYWQQKQP